MSVAYGSLVDGKFVAGSTPAPTGTYSPAYDASGKVTGYNTDKGFQSTTPPAPAASAPDSGYYSRTTDSGDGTVAAPTPQSVEEVQAAKTKAAQAQIDALNQYYADLSNEQTTINDKNDRSTASINTLSGLAGSTEANVTQQETTKQGQQSLDKIKNEQSVAIQGILSKIRDDAVTEARQQRLDYNQSVTDSIANRAALAKQAADHVTNLTAAGVTADGLKASDPTSYNHLLTQYGGDEAALKGAFVLNTPKDQILGTSVVGGSMVISRQNPLTGKVTVDSVDLGLPAGSVQVADAGGYILFGKAGADGKWDGDMSTTTKINKTMTPDAAAKANAGSGDTSGYNGEFAATIDLASNANKSATNAQRADVKSQLQSFIAQGDYPSAYRAIVQATKAGLTSATAATFENAVNLGSTLTDLQTALKAYSDAGGDTNILKGNLDTVGTKIGALTNDPKYKTIAVQLDTAFQNYRHVMTGANFSPAESNSYASVLPNKGNTIALNLATIQGALNAANSTTEANIVNVVGEGGIYIKQYAEKGASPTTSDLSVTAPDGQSYTFPDQNSLNAFKRLAGIP